MGPSQIHSARSTRDESTARIPRFEYKCKRQEYAAAIRSRNSIHVLTLLRPGCHRRPELRGPRLTPRVPPQLHSFSSVPLIHRAASPYRSERASGNPKLCAAATRGHLNQCLSNWVKSFQSMLINFISVYLSRYVCLGQNFVNRMRDEIISVKSIILITTYFLIIILIVALFFF